MGRAFWIVARTTLMQIRRGAPRGLRRGSSSECAFLFLHRKMADSEPPVKRVKHEREEGGRAGGSAGGASKKDAKEAEAIVLRECKKHSQWIPPPVCARPRGSREASTPASTPFARAPKACVPSGVGLLVCYGAARGRARAELLRAGRFWSCAGGPRQVAPQGI